MKPQRTGQHEREDDPLSPLAASFYARPSPVVARDLLGRLLVEERGPGRVVGRIVESEAYEEGDPASHSFRGPTPRNSVMFGAPGRMYVYFTYGMHHCMNVVTGSDGEGSAVLLRAVEPLEGIDVMCGRRGVAARPLLCSGPGRLCQAYGVGRADNGHDLLDSASGLFIAAGDPLSREHAAAGPRVGVREAAERPWRFFEEGSVYVSRRSPGRRRPGR